MKHIIVPLTAFPDYLEHFQKNPEPCIINCPPPKAKIVVAPSVSSEFNEEVYNGIENACITRPMHNGGTIIVFEDGITIFVFSEQVFKGYKEQIADYLKSRGINACGKGNDILCDGYKIAGDMQRNLADIGYHYYGIHISINADIDVINRLCTKPMLKPPRGLSYYGVTRKDIMDLLQIPDND